MCLHLAHMDAKGLLNNVSSSLQKRYTFRNEAGAATVDIFSEIDDWWGFGVRELSYQLSALPKGQPLTVRIHSPGGMVTEGIGIRNLLRAYPGEVTTVGVGFVASIASIILMAGSKIQMADNAYLMIHRPYGGNMGNADEMRQVAGVLDNMEENLLDMYMEAITRNGKDTKRETVREWMNAETWFTAKEALDAGFIGEVITAEEVPTTQENFTALAKYEHTPAQLLTNNFQEMAKEETGVIAKIRALLSGETHEAEAQTASAEETNQVDTVQEPTLDEMRQKLEAAGFVVNQAQAETQEEETEEVNEMAELMAQMAEQIKTLRAQVAKTVGTPSGGSTSQRNQKAPTKTKRDEQFDAFADYVKAKILQR